MTIRAGGGVAGRGGGAGRGAGGREDGAAVCGCGAARPRAPRTFLRMLEITPINTMAIQMSAPMPCTIRPYLGGCVWPASGGGPPSTLPPIASRMPVSACRFFRR